MDILIQSTITTLDKTKSILSILSDKLLSNITVPPYHSSIGSHIRHVLDYYDCILVTSNLIDLTTRKRNIEIESDCIKILNYFNEIIEKLNKINVKDLERIVLVTDDLSLGKTKIKYTFSGLLAQANSHTLHHYAIINYILEGLGICLKDDTFGYNPTTPKVNILN